MASREIGPAHRWAPRLAWAAAGIGVLYALISTYWAVGGTWLLDTVGGSLERDARARGIAVDATIWAVVVLKLIASALPIWATTPDHARTRVRILRRLAGLEAIILVVYGLLLTTVGLLVQVDVIARSAHADQRALAWHAFLWDPWFLVWGLMVAAALGLSRKSVSAAAT